MSEEEKVIPENTEAAAEKPVGIDSLAPDPQPETEKVQEEAAVENGPAQKKEYPPVSAATKIDMAARGALARIIILTNWLPFAILSLVIIALGALIWGLTQDEVSTMGLYIMIAGAVVPAAFFGVLYWLAKFNSRKSPGAKTVRMITLTFDKNITGTETVEVTEPEEIAPPARDVSYEYSQFVNFRENKEYFFLFSDARTAIVVRKGGITDGDADSLRGILTQEIGIKK